MLDATVPTGAGSVLDVGCGDGFLASRLSRRCPDVTAVDVDGPVLRRAQARFPDAEVRWLNADILTVPLELKSFDAVVSNAALHHLDDTSAALQRLKSLVAPGGILAVVGFVRLSPRNALWHATSFVATGIATTVRGKWDHTAPIVWPPADTLRELKRHARRALPGVVVRRLLYGRILLTWRSPGTWSS